MKAIFKPQAKGLLEKEWIADFKDVPEGWYTSKDEALAAWKEPVEKAPKKAPKE